MRFADVGIAAPGAFADALPVLPVDDGDVILAGDAVEAHQAVRRQFLDQRAHGLGVEGIAGEDLHLDGAWSQGLGAELIGEGLQAEEQQARHRRAVDDGFTGPEIGREGSAAGHEGGLQGSNAEAGLRSLRRRRPFQPLRLSIWAVGP